MPTWLYGVVTVVLGIVASIIGLWLVRRSVKLSILQDHHDVAGFIIAVLGVIYAVLLAFVVIVVWERFDAAQTIVAEETNAMMNVYHLARVFPDPQQHSLRHECENYAEIVIHQEWPAMDHQDEAPQALDALNALWGTLDTIQPANVRETTFYGEAVKSLEDLDNHRRQRLLASREGLPNVMWVVLIVGGIATVVFTYFFGVSNFGAQALMTTLLAGEIALVLFLVGAINYPFTGDVKVYPHAFEHSYQTMKRLDIGEQASTPALPAAPVPSHG